MGDVAKEFQPFQCSARVYTWGSEIGATDLGHSLKARMTGGNVGHASIALRFPADERGKALIEKYCEKNRIPHVLKEVKIPKLKFKKDAQGNYTKEYEVTDEIAYGAKYYEVYFSWWPGLKGFDLKKNLEEDQLLERKGVHFEWDKEFIKDDEIEVDRRRKMTLPPDLIIHNIPKEADIGGLKHELETYAFNNNKLRRLKNQVFRLRLQIDKLKQNPKLEKALKTCKEKSKDLDFEIGELVAWLNDAKNKFKKAGIDSKHFVKGLPPKHVINLPVVDSQNVGNQNRAGLDLEGMLKAMDTVVNNGKGFDLYSKNCSATTNEVIAGGMDPKDKELNKRFRRSSVVGLATPQVVFQSALRTTGHFYPPDNSKKGIMQRFVLFLKALASYFKSKNTALEGKKAEDKKPTPSEAPPDDASRKRTH